MRRAGYVLDLAMIYSMSLGGLTFVVLRSLTRAVVFFKVFLFCFSKRHVTLSSNKIFHEGQYIKLIKEKLPLPLDHDLHIHSPNGPLHHLYGTLQTYGHRRQTTGFDCLVARCGADVAHSESSCSYLFHMLHCTLSSGHTARSTPASPRHCQGRLSGLCTHTWYQG